MALGLSCSKPAFTRATVFTLTDPDPTADKIKWEFTPSTGDVFTLNTTSSGTDSGNVLQSDIDSLHIWLPPLQAFSVRARQRVSAVWSDWTTALNCTSRGYENSFDKFNSLNEGTITSG